MAPPFRPPRARDAWGAIRGFVYQVDVTIERWLALGDAEALALECGEDVDRIAGALGSEDARLLEQVKVREDAISLRSAAAIEALANAAETLETNPTIRVTFRFTTTATVARENDHPAPTMAPGIELWEVARTTTKADDVHVAAAADVIRRLVRAAERPARVPATTWGAAVATFTDDARLDELIRRFQWATGEASPEDRAIAIVAAIRAAGHAAGEEEATRVHEHLFAFVFRLLWNSPGFVDTPRSVLTHEE